MLFFFEMFSVLVFFPALIAINLFAVYGAWVLTGEEG